MPKKTRDFPARIDFLATDEMRDQLVAISYLMGAGGEYSTPARNLLKRAIDNHMEGLSDKERTEFDEILANVRLRREYASDR